MTTLACEPACLVSRQRRGMPMHAWPARSAGVPRRRACLPVRP